MGRKPEREKDNKKIQSIVPVEAKRRVIGLWRFPLSGPRRARLNSALAEPFNRGSFGKCYRGRSADRTGAHNNEKSF